LMSLAANSFKRPVTRNLDDSFRNCYG
jgi:hypothetical protein